MRPPWHHCPVPPWFDTHVHLDRYAPEERAALLARAAAADVAVIGAAVDVDSSRALARINGLRGHTVGVHPRYAGTPAAALATLAGDKGVVAIGECGFDDAGPDYDLQALAFRAQCMLARSQSLPLVLHIDGPGAWAQLTANGDALEGLPVVRHYFTGDATQAAWHRECGHYLSFGNPLRRSAALREIARAYPADLQLIETDSYPIPGRNTEPMHVPLIGETLALLHGWTFDEARERLAEHTVRAFPRLANG
jgi:TatD DNase family protein